MDRTSHGERMDQALAASLPVMKIGDALIHRVEEHRIPNKISYFTTDEELLAEIGGDNIELVEEED